MAASGPSLILGTMPFGDTVGESAARAIVEEALELGVAELDTANTYAGGASEEILGRVAPVGIPISSKVGMQPAAEGRGPLAPEAILAQARLSTDRLGRGLDTLYLHQPDRSTPIADTLAGVLEVLDQGLASRLGLSNYSAWETVEITHACERLGLSPPLRAQQLYNPLARRLELEFLPFARARGVETVAYNPLAGGLLTGRHRFESLPTDGRYGDSRLAVMYRDRYWTRERFAVIDQLREVADGAGMPLVEMCLRWTCGHEGVTAMLVGGSRPEQIRENIAAAGRGPLPDAVHRRIDDLTSPLIGDAPHYAR
ncbi:aldo/keto reductase [Ruania suaedae]|uniref:aldo/keto reductase n=1 Tax=Ruania suaedae TaxID=2897774 RepID=UPI001E61BC16|nr:aldo/keto reductase [Ruania suaedae]UFU03782.1 aldo/keto reductase [Ruania suaedae]